MAAGNKRNVEHKKMLQNERGARYFGRKKTTRLCACFQPGSGPVAVLRGSDARCHSASDEEVNTPSAPSGEAHGE